MTRRFENYRLPEANFTRLYVADRVAQSPGMPDPSDPCIAFGGTLRNTAGLYRRH